MKNGSSVKAAPLDALTATLTEALRALAGAGEAERACGLAGQAYAALRREHPVQAQRINALMHRLTRNLDHTEEQRCPPPNRSSTSAPSHRPAVTS